jgi:hypothetical protein
MVEASHTGKAYVKCPKDDTRHTAVFNSAMKAE